MRKNTIVKLAGSFVPHDAKITDTFDDIAYTRDGLEEGIETFAEVNEIDRYVSIDSSYTTLSFYVKIDYVSFYVDKYLGGKDDDWDAIYEQVEPRMEQIVEKYKECAYIEGDEIVIRISDHGPTKLDAWHSGVWYELEKIIADILEIENPKFVTPASWVAELEPGEVIAYTDDAGETYTANSISDLAYELLSHDIATAFYQAVAKIVRDGYIINPEEEYYNEEDYDEDFEEDENY